MRETKPVIINVSFKTKVKNELLLYSRALPKFEEYGTSEYMKIALKEKLDRDEKE